MSKTLLTKVLESLLQDNIEEANKAFSNYVNEKSKVIVNEEPADEANE